jgi:hypothetical protein
MEMKVYLKWWEVVICLLLITYPLFLILTTMNDKNSLRGEKYYLEDSFKRIEFKKNRLPESQIKFEISFWLEHAKLHVDTIYLFYENSRIFSYVLMILIILLYVGSINQQRKYEQTITQLEWALKEEKEKSKER